MDRWQLGLIVLGVGLAVAVTGSVVDGPVHGTDRGPEIADGPPSASPDRHITPWANASEVDGANGSAGQGANGSGSEDATVTTVGGANGTVAEGTTPPLQTLDAEREGELAVHAINVGQADATLLVTPSNEVVLIDTGHGRDDGEFVLDYLDAHGITRIDYLVATHGHWDHIGGHPAVIDRYERELDGVGELLDPGVPHTTTTYEAYLDAVEDHDLTLQVVREGDDLEIDPALEVTVLNPPEGDRAEELNEDSIVLHVEYDEASVLLPGDAERDAERRLAERYGDELSADLYKAGHHGSNTSSNPWFVDHVDPEVALVSSAHESPFGHPNDEVLVTFTYQDVETYWTAVHGSTVAVTEGDDWDYYTQANATTDPREIRAEPEVPVRPEGGVELNRPDCTPAMLVAGAHCDGERTVRGVGGD